MNINSKIIDICNTEFSDNNTFKEGESYVPVSGKVLSKLEISYMMQSSLDANLTAGRFNSQFEKKLSKFLGVRHLITVNSGSSANLIAFSTLCSPTLGDKQIKEGDEVITVAAGFPTTVNPIIQNNAIPVFVDIQLSNYNIDHKLIKSAITNKTKAIMLAHTLGNPFNLNEIKKICNDNNLWLIEDCCDALGTKYDNKIVGTFGDISTLSFYPAHHITMGEGGAVFTNNSKLKRIAQSIRDWGRDCYCDPGCDNTCKKRFNWQLGQLPNGYDHKYIYSQKGFNFKITDMQAACGLAQLESLEYFINTRKKNFLYLRSKLEDLEDFFILPTATENSDPSWFGFAITLKDRDINRTELLQELENRKIGSRLIFGGNLTKQPYFSKINYKIQGNLKNTDIIMKNSFWVGIYPGLDKRHLDYISTNLKEILIKS